MTDTTDLVAVKDRLPANLRRQPGERARDYLLRRLAVAKGRTANRPGRLWRAPLDGVLVRHQRAELADPRKRLDRLEHVVVGTVFAADRVDVNDLESRLEPGAAEPVHQAVSASATAG